jgi:hypothetical protein
MRTNTSEPTMELFNRKLLIFNCYQLDVKDIKCPFQWWEKNEYMFPPIGFYARQILGIFRSQIEMKRIFSLVGILTSFKRCCLQSKNLDNLIFVNKNWPNDPMIGCKSRFNLVELIGIDVDLEEEFEEFEGTFKRDEFMEF